MISGKVWSESLNVRLNEAMAVAEIEGDSDIRRSYSFKLNAVSTSEGSIINNIRLKLHSVPNKAKSTMIFDNKRFQTITPAHQ